MRRLAAVAIAGMLAGCSAPPVDLVVSHTSNMAAWTATGKVVYTEKLDGAPTRYVLRRYDPVAKTRADVVTVTGTPLYLSADDTDRVLLEGINGAYTIYKQEDGSVLASAVTLPDTQNGYVSLHLSASGTKILLATLPPTPSLQIHSAADGSTSSNFASVEGTATIREMASAPDDSAIYYLRGDPTGAQPDAIVRFDVAGQSKTTVYQDAAIPFLDRVFVSNDGATLLVSGEDAAGKTGAWLLPASAAAAPVQLAAEGGSRLTVRAASGLSPDGKHFLLFSTTARGTLLTVEDVPAS